MSTMYCSFARGTKWWPGAMGRTKQPSYQPLAHCFPSCVWPAFPQAVLNFTVRTANYAIVYARLIVQGQDLGIHNFMVQIRDLQTHKPMMGVEVGDIGPKIGYNNQDCVTLV